jgi:FkbM family methyltransferase
VARLPSFVEAGALPRSAAALALDGRLPAQVLAEILGLAPGTIEAECEAAPRRRAEEREADLQRIEHVAADAFTSTLMRMFVEQLAAGSTPGSPSPRYTDRPLELKVKVFDRTLELHVPHAAGSIAGVYEIFVKENYALPPDAVRPDTIYDLGANLGLSALYLAARFPEARLVCVEPVEENLRWLRQNLDANRVEGRTLQVALGPSAGRARLELSEVVLMHSTAFGAAGGTALRGERMVEMLPIEQIVEGDGFGLKIDVEGAEFAIVDAPAAWSRACWILGEVHGGSFVEPARFHRFLDLVRRGFALELGPPRITGEVVAHELRALPRAAPDQGGAR